MNPLNMVEVSQFIEDNIGTFHKKRIDNLSKLDLKTILKRKNPYLFKAKNIHTSEVLIRTLVDAYLSSGEETVFGNFLEVLAIFINNKVYRGEKSSAEGIDLEFTMKEIRYLISIKSGPNWGNRDQIKKMRQNFKNAMRTLRTSGSKLHIEAICGCCYGRDRNPDKGDYFKYCGQKFWEFISGDPNLYIDIIKPLGYKAKQKNDEVLKLVSHNHK